MSWLDDLLGGGNQDNASADSAPPAGPANAPPANGSVAPSYGDYFTQLQRAAQLNSAQAPQRPGLAGLFSWMSGGQRDAMQANAAVGAPDAYFKMLQGQNTADNGALDNGQTAIMLANGGHPVNPNDIRSSLMGRGTQPAAVAPGPVMPVMPGAAPGSPAPTPQAQPGNVAPPALPSQPDLTGGAPAANGPPSANSPAGAPTAPPPGSPPGAPPIGSAPTQPGNPADALRAKWGAMAAQSAGLPKYLPQAAELQKLSQTGVPAGAIGGPNGAAVDGITGAPVGNITAQDYAARGAGLTAGSEATARIPAASFLAKQQAALDVGTHLANVKADASRKFSDVTDATTGLKSPKSDEALATAEQAAPGAAPAFNRGLAENPYRPEQIKQIAKAQSDAGDATVGQNLTEQLQSAIKITGTSGPLTGPALAIGQKLMQLGLLTDKAGKKVGAAELANMDSNSIVSAMAKAAAAGRVPLGIYNQINKTKPSLLSGNPTMALEALRQDFIRSQDFGKFAATYYGPTSTKLDAQTAFDQAHPIAQYQSRVIPLAKPANKSDMKAGYTYNTGAKGAPLSPHVWNGQNFVQGNGS
jgi:hypothetical protein